MCAVHIPKGFSIKKKAKGTKTMFSRFGIDKELQALDAELMAMLEPRFRDIDAIRDENQLRVLAAFQQNGVAARHMMGSSGYGYGDDGRDNLDRVMASIMGAEAALCREQFMSGTHALTVALFGLLRAGDTLLAATGRPYDTLGGVIGLSEERYGSLAEYGVRYEEAPFAGDDPDYDRIRELAPRARVVHIQRSRGYSSRRSLSCADIEKIARTVKSANPDAIVFVDNCYGEYCETAEPTMVGADIAVGSLIKNPGGGIAETGGYIAGRAELVELCAHRLTAPGTGGEIGCWPSGHRNTYLGLYLGPSVTAEAVKSSVYASALFERLGYTAAPHWQQPRYDIVTTLGMGSEKGLTALCRGIQAMSPVDSVAVPEAWEMPGYEDKVIMAAGTFTGGSSIELSCDAPIRPPYTAYLQGGLSFTASRAAFLKAAQMLRER